MSKQRDIGEIDGWIENASRWASTRMTRRSFLGRFGRTAMVVAAGPVIGGLLAGRAEARVCGQTGVSPRCAAFDCDDIWGWCWYATGCCADGLLKKICDCCARGWPNVQGYCPSGHAVRCIVESCGTDPRVQHVSINRISTDMEHEVAGHVRSMRFGGVGPAAVIGDRNGLWPAIATPVAAMLGGHAFLTYDANIDQSVIDEIRAQWGSRAFIIGSRLSKDLDARLMANGIEVNRVGSSFEIQTFSGEVATWVRDHIGPRDAVAITPEGLSAAAAPLAAAFGSTLHMPVIVGPRVRRSGGGMYLVGPEASAYEREFPGAVVVNSDSLGGISGALWNEAVNRGASRERVVLAPAGWGPIWEIAGFGTPLLIHDPGSVMSVRGWIAANRERIGQVFLSGVWGSIQDGHYKLLQSDLNGFEIMKLTGGAGQGLPVYDQPAGERPVGRARLGTDPPPPRPAPKRRAPRRRTRRRRTRRRR